METACAAPAQLLVATDLSRIEAPAGLETADHTVVENGKTYRTLTSQYYAWLRHKMSIARGARDAGRLSVAQFEELRRRFNGIHGWAVGHLGEAALIEAVKEFDPATYEPPERREERAPAETSAHSFPTAGDFPFTETITFGALAKVDAIREQAMQLGWTEAQLYQNRGHLSFPYGDEYGLVCFVKDRQTITDVTRESIALMDASGRVFRFYNPAVDQTWRQKVDDKAVMESPAPGRTASRVDAPPPARNTRRAKDRTRRQADPESRAMKDATPEAQVSFAFGCAAENRGKSESAGVAS